MIDSKNNMFSNELSKNFTGKNLGFSQPNTTSSKQISIPNYIPKKIELVSSGEDYFSRLERIILESKQEIQIQTYIFEYDSIGKRIVDALKEAASRNVKVYMLLDGFGSSSFSSKIHEELIRLGIQIRFFSPLFSLNSLYIGRRLHQKVVVSDSKIALVGGINIAEKYHGTKSIPTWLDYAVEINDEIQAVALSKICKAIFLKNRSFNRRKFTALNNSNQSIQILQNDWLYGKNDILKAYLNAFANAKQEIIIVGSYFLPGKKLIKTLLKASQRKVKVKLILSGISDLPMARRASCYLYSKLLRNNIEIYEWSKSILHAKTAVVDSNWTTIGSFNLNNLSSYASIELNIGIKSEEFAVSYLSYLNKIVGECTQITSESITIKKGLFSKIINWISYWFIRIIENIMIYLPHNRYRIRY